ncbi:MAG TPA: hypothetical protein VK129_01715, partial [Terriglobales bacterium]|nr:hypothetical protein [Terriglobales bacterium]
MPNTISQNDQKEVMRRYLFDELSMEERVNFEKHYAADRDLFEELVAFENDLVDAYARGALTESERKNFASRYLTTPQRQRRVKFAESLLDYASKSESPLTPDHVRAEGSEAFQLKEWFGIHNFFQLHPRAAAIAFTSVVAVSICLLVFDLKLRDKLREFQAEQAHMVAEKQQLSAQMKTLTEELQNLSVHNDRDLKPAVTPPGQGIEVAQLTIAPGLLRSGDHQNVLVISPGASSARLQLKLDHREYS